MFKHVMYFLTGTTVTMACISIVLVVTHFHTVAQILKLGVTGTLICILLYALGYLVCNFIDLLNTDEQEALRGCIDYEGLPSISGNCNKEK